LDAIDTIPSRNPFARALRQVMLHLPSRDARKAVSRRARTEIHFGPSGISVHRGQSLDRPLAAAAETHRSLGAIAAQLGPRERFVISFSEPFCFMRNAMIPASALVDARPILNLEMERITPFKRTDVVDVYSIDPNRQGPDAVVRHALVRRSELEAYRQQLGPKLRNLVAVAFRDSDAAALPQLLDADGRVFGANRERFWVRSMLAGVAAVLLISAATAYLAHRQINGAQAQIDDAVPLLQAKAKAIREKTDQAAKQNAFADSIIQQRKNALSVTRVWEELTKQIPDGAWVQALVVNEQTGRVDGLADNPEELISILERSEMLSDVKFASPLIRNPGETKSQFSISFSLEGPKT
jgi:general secretion pathway protein L